MLSKGTLRTNKNTVGTTKRTLKAEKLYRKPTNEIFVKSATVTRRSVAIVSRRAYFSVQYNFKPTTFNVLLHPNRFLIVSMPQEWISWSKASVNYSTYQYLPEATVQRSSQTEGRRVLRTNYTYLIAIKIQQMPLSSSLPCFDFFLGADATTDGRIIASRFIKNPMYILVSILCFRGALISAWLLCGLSTSPSRDSTTTESCYLSTRYLIFRPCFYFELFWRLQREYLLLYTL